MSTSFPVLWKGSRGRGLKGLVEVHESDLPQHNFQDAKVSDLATILTPKIRGATAGSSREVGSILLYGTRLDENRRLEAIIPDLGCSSPRLLAITRVRPTDSTDVFVVVETLTGKKTRVPCALTDTVAKLKLRVQNSEGHPANRQILVFNNTRLEDHQALVFYTIRSRSIIYLVLKLSRLRTSSQRLTRIPEAPAVEQRDLATFPRWRIASEGLNIEGCCENLACPAFRQTVIYPYQFESFNIALDGCILCPMCRFQVEPLTCGFYNCAWKFEGVRARDGLSVISPWKDADNNGYNTFDKEICGTARWRSLLFVVKPRGISNAAKLTESLDSRVTKDNICLICWTKVWSIDRSASTAVPCGHTFHRRCIDKWSKWCSDHTSLPSCPVCRKPLQVAAGREPAELPLG